MVRRDDDTWNITESVGATALICAARRAAETDSADPLFNDPFAKLFLDAAGDGMWSVFSTANLPDKIAEVDPELPARILAMRDYTASRTAFFDEYLLAATNAGIRQAVILAAGLDTRAWRLPWPDGTTVYELDQPRVLEFKSAVLTATGAQPGALDVNVPVDLRQDWPKAIQHAGYDASTPTVWVAEGLFPFLPSAARDVLIDRVQSLSAPGSRIAVEALSRDILNPERRRRLVALDRTRRLAAARLSVTDISDFDDLWYLDDWTDAAERLRGHGWVVTVASLPELMARYHRNSSHEDATPPNVVVSARSESTWI